jgi:hypothetical protein
LACSGVAGGGAVLVSRFSHQWPMWRCAAGCWGVIEVRLLAVVGGPTLDYADAAAFLAGFATMIEKVRRRRLQ